MGIIKNFLVTFTKKAKHKSWHKNMCSTTFSLVTILWKNIFKIFMLKKSTIPSFDGRITTPVTIKLSFFPISFRLSVSFCLSWRSLTFYIVLKIFVEFLTFFSKTAPYARKFSNTAIFKLNMLRKLRFLF